MAKPEEKTVVRRDPVAEKLAQLLTNLEIAKAVINAPNSLAARLLIRANAISIDSDQREEEKAAEKKTP